MSDNDAKKPTDEPKNDISREKFIVNSDNDSTPPKNLSDMPIYVVGLIVERSDYREQLKLRKVSKSLRVLVDSQKPACKSIKVITHRQHINIAFDNHFVERYDFMKPQFDNLASTLQNPKLQLEEFSVRCCCSEKEKFDEYTNKIKRVMESLNHQVSVKEFEINVLSPPSILAVLPYLKPGVLEKISLSVDVNFVDWRSDTTGTEQIALLDQWKQAEELELQDSFDRFPMKYATHFKRFNIYELFTKDEKIVRIIEYFSKLDDFEHCTLSFNRSFFDPYPVYQFLGAPVPSNTMDLVFHHTIPDSGYYLELSFSRRYRQVGIEKKKREIF